jgi:glutaminyl-peptide cyclotransferase
LANDLSQRESRPYSRIVWDYLTVLCDFGPRYLGSAGYKKTIQLIQDTGLKYANEVEYQSFYPLESLRGNEGKFVNLILKFNGSEQAGKPLLIGAHYDTRPFADEESDPDRAKQPIVGANDGGSGTALLLGLAEWLKSHPPRQPVHLVFFDGEDYGMKESGQMLLGSIHMASRIQVQEEEGRPRGVLILDMLADSHLEIFKENYSLKSAPDMVEALFSIAERNNFAQFKDKSKYSIYDDHYPFLKMGIPSAVLIDMDYPDWHKLTDTLDKCSEESLAAVFSVVTEWLETQ